jgi:L-asparaginase II
MLCLDVVVTRGTLIESRHRVHAAVVNAAGDMIASTGDPGITTHWRSCAKPFQIMPLLREGGFDRIGWGDDQLALSCGSHGGEPEHVAIAEAMLASIGMEEGDLACGPHDPLAARGQKILREAGQRPTRLHNNCSGKHAAMLARAHTAGWGVVGYERSEHPVQQACLSEVSEWTGVPAADINCAVDGCGVVVFGLPLAPMATAYARLADAVRRSQEIPSRIVHAMQTRPFLVGGSDRFDSALIEGQCADRGDRGPSDREGRCRGCAFPCPDRRWNRHCPESGGWCPARTVSSGHRCASALRRLAR